MKVATPERSEHGAATTLFIARQPIFCRRSRRVGYELLYRRSARATRAEGVSRDVMAAEVITHALLDMQPERLSEGGISFINVTRDMLLSGCLESFRPHEVVFEVLETVQVDREVLAACRRLRGLGFRLALDDFEAGTGLEPLLELAEIVKIDTLNRATGELQGVVDGLRPHGMTLLAERVETPEVLRASVEIGFDLFQGYHFGRPVTVGRRKVSAEQIAIIQLMNLLNREQTTDVAVEEAFRSDVSLSYTLLQIVNSAAVGGRGIQSIRHAIRLTGRAALRRWLALLLVSASAAPGDIGREQVRLAYVRARFCERIAELSGRRRRADSHFMVGLFSLLDAIFGMPMDDILERVNLAPEITRAVLFRRGAYADTIDLAEACERGEWTRAATLLSRMDVPRKMLGSSYREAIDWARDRVRAMPSG